ncbi:MAG: KEOPS complex subunit Cgi121 [Candidatus Micrarchaeota archaeon]
MLSALKVGSEKEIEEILERIKGNGYKAALLDEEAVCCLEQLEGAYFLAKKSVKEGKEISKNIGIEFLLWLSGSGHVENAIGKVGAKKKENMVFVLFDGSEKEAGRKAGEIGLKVNGKVEKAGEKRKEEIKKIIEKMAISRIS